MTGPKGIALSNYRDLIEPTDEYLDRVSQPTFDWILTSYRSDLLSITEPPQGRSRFYRARETIRQLIGGDDRALIGVVHYAADRLIRAALEADIPPNTSRTWFPDEALREPYGPLKLLAPYGVWDTSRASLTMRLAIAGPGPSTVDLAAYLVVAVDNSGLLKSRLPEHAPIEKPARDQVTTNASLASMRSFTKSPSQLRLLAISVTSSLVTIGSAAAAATGASASISGTIGTVAGAIGAVGVYLSVTHRNQSSVG